MAKNIYCPDCDKRIKASAKGRGELYESIGGKAIKKLFCDSCGNSNDDNTAINIGEECFAAVVLPSRSHPNYEKQKPEVWAKDFIKPNNELL